MFRVVFGIALFSTVFVLANIDQQSTQKPKHLKNMHLLENVMLTKQNCETNNHKKKSNKKYYCFDTK